MLLYISLAEPMLFLQGIENADDSNRGTAMLRGSLTVRLTKPVKIKAISLNFRGRARTEWPEGIPPRNVDLYEEEILNRHTWPFFNAAFQTTGNCHGTDFVRLASGGCSATSGSVSPSAARLAFDQFLRSASPSSNGVSTKEQRHRSLQMARSRSRSVSRDERGNDQTCASHKGHRTFQAGDYVYSFELPLDRSLPETINVDLGSVRYELEAVVERAGAFRSNVVGVREVTLVRTPAEGSLEHVEPIAISRDWEDQLHYDIVVSGKSFPLGAQVPIAFKLTPLAKIQCHRIRIYLTENVEYYCSNRKVHRMEPVKKVQLLEKKADSPSVSAFPGSSVRIVAGGGLDDAARRAAGGNFEPVIPGCNNLLGDLTGMHNAGPTEMEFSVQLPGCPSSAAAEKGKRIHFDTTFGNIQVHHWIKIVMRLSRPDHRDPTKRRHFEISIDSPLNILSCRATSANTALPAYSSAAPLSDGRQSAACQCPGSLVRPTASSARHRMSTGSTPSAQGLRRAAVPPAGGAAGGEGGVNTVTVPPYAHIINAQRPIHLLRHPSFDPPAFDAEVPPPPLLSPPPRYESVVDGNGLADYFSRRADESGDDDPTDPQPPAHTGGRINLPLTPGGRLNRSMDEARTWLPPG